MRQTAELGSFERRRYLSGAGLRLTVPVVLGALAVVAVAGAVPTRSRAASAAACAAHSGGGISNGMIAFTRRYSAAVAPGFDNSGSWHLMVVNCDGTGEQELVTDALNPAWSPDGNELAFIDGSDQSIWVMDIADRVKRRLTSGGTTLPTWSPDGSKIAYVQSLGDGGSGGALMVMNASDGSGKTRIYDGTASSPAWGTPGIAVNTTPPCDGNGSLYLINPNGATTSSEPCQNYLLATTTYTGSGVSLKASVNTVASTAEWSRDGQLAAVLRGPQTEATAAATITPGQVYRVQFPCTGAMIGAYPASCYDELTNLNGVNGVKGLAWSPDGEYFALATTPTDPRSSPSATWRTQVGIMSSNGGAFNLITDPAKAAPNKNAYDLDVAWQPCLPGVTVALGTESTPCVSTPSTAPTPPRGSCRKPLTVVISAPGASALRSGPCWTRIVIPPRESTHGCDTAKSGQYWAYNEITSPTTAVKTTKPADVTQCADAHQGASGILFYAANADANGVWNVAWPIPSRIHPRWQFLELYGCRQGCDRDIVTGDLGSGWTAYEKSFAPMLNVGGTGSPAAVGHAVLTVCKAITGDAIGIYWGGGEATSLGPASLKADLTAVTTALNACMS